MAVFGFSRRSEVRSLTLAFPPHNASYAQKVMSGIQDLLGDFTLIAQNEQICETHWRLDKSHSAGSVTVRSEIKRDVGPCHSGASLEQAHLECVPACM